MKKLPMKNYQWLTNYYTHTPNHKLTRRLPYPSHVTRARDNNVFDDGQTLAQQLQVSHKSRQC